MIYRYSKHIGMILAIIVLASILFTVISFRGQVLVNSKIAEEYQAEKNISIDTLKVIRTRLETKLFYGELSDEESATLKEVSNMLECYEYISIKHSLLFLYIAFGLFTYIGYFFLPLFFELIIEDIYERLYNLREALRGKWYGRAK